MRGPGARPAGEGAARGAGGGHGSGTRGADVAPPRPPAAPPRPALPSAATAPVAGPAQLLREARDGADCARPLLPLARRAATQAPGAAYVPLLTCARPRGAAYWSARGAGPTGEGRGSEPRLRATPPRLGRVGRPVTRFHPHLGCDPNASSATGRRIGTAVCKPLSPARLSVVVKKRGFWRPPVPVQTPSGHLLHPGRHSRGNSARVPHVLAWETGARTAAPPTAAETS